MNKIKGPSQSNLLEYIQVKKYTQAFCKAEKKAQGNTFPNLVTVQDLEAAAACNCLSMFEESLISEFGLSYERTAYPTTKESCLQKFNACEKSL